MTKVGAGGRGLEGCWISLARGWMTTPSLFLAKTFTLPCKDLMATTTSAVGKGGGNLRALGNAAVEEPPVMAALDWSYLFISSISRGWRCNPTIISKTIFRGGRCNPPASRNVIFRGSHFDGLH